jgi:hypothetical protein
MDKLNRLLAASPSEFAAAFDAVGDEAPVQAGRATATLWLEGGTTCAGAGFAWGRGEINYQGRSHGFRLSGLSIADLDAGGVCANGSVMHLRKLSDFGGTYAASTVDAAAAAGADSTTYLKNEHGVVLKLSATDSSWRINLLVNGLRVRLKRSK